MRANHRNLFDILRLAAAVLVFYSHLYPLFGLPGPDRIVRMVHFISGGSLGVGIFFAISGYLVTQSLDRSSGITSFYARRALRILPALAAVLILAAFVLGPLLTNRSMARYFGDPQVLDYVRSNLLMDLRVYLPGVFETNPYKGTVNGSLWTLPGEAGLYLVLPILVRLTTNRRQSLAIGCLVAGALYFWFSRFDPDAAGQLGPMVEVTRNATIFLVGAVIATTENWRLSSRQIAILALIAVLTATTRYGDLLFLVLLPVLVIGIGMRQTRFQMPFGADISYGFYLYAFPAQQATYQLLSGKASYAAMAAVAFATAVLCAIASWFLIEAPILKRRSVKHVGVVIDGLPPNPSKVVL